MQSRTLLDLDVHSVHVEAGHTVSLKVSKTSAGSRSPPWVQINKLHSPRPDSARTAPSGSGSPRPASSSAPANSTRRRSQRGTNLTGTLVTFDTRKTTAAAIRRRRGHEEARSAEGQVSALSREGRYKIYKEPQRERSRGRKL